MSAPTAEHPPKRRRRWRLLGTLALGAALLAILFDFFPETQRAVRQGVRESVIEALPDAAERAASVFGIAPLSEGPPTTTAARRARPSVLLVPGLDDPGLAWSSLAPELVRMGLDVWELTYPNDQPIADSAQFLFDQFAELRQADVERVAIVAHSMGGLVTREMLTSPEIGYATAAGEGSRPIVSDLIMVATPNHGSEMARFRGFAEARELWVNSVLGGESLLRSIVDGAGEARLDLFPDSRFLQALNARPHPIGVEMLIIAGTLGRWQSDGLVSVDSTRLDGIEHHTVAGTHATIIRNVGPVGDRVPPAVPLIASALRERLMLDPNSARAPQQ